MTQTHSPQSAVLRQLRLIASAALAGVCVAGAISGFIDPANIDLYRSIGGTIAALALITTGAYRTL